MREPARANSYLHINKAILDVGLKTQQNAYSNSTNLYSTYCNMRSAGEASPTNCNLTLMLLPNKNAPFLYLQEMGHLKHALT